MGKSKKRNSKNNSLRRKSTKSNKRRFSRKNKRRFSRKNINQKGGSVSALPGFAPQTNGISLQNSKGPLQEIINNDGFGIQTARIFTGNSPEAKTARWPWNEDGIDSGNRGQDCGCIAGKYIKNVFEQTQVNYTSYLPPESAPSMHTLINGGSIPEDKFEYCYFLPNSLPEMYTISHFFPVTAFKAENWNCLNPGTKIGQDWHGNPAWGSGAMGKYLAWMLIGSVSALICTNIHSPHKPRNPRLYSFSQPNQQDSGVGIRYCIDKYCWDLLAILHTFPITNEGGKPDPRGTTVGRPFEKRWDGPFKQTVYALGKDIDKMIPNHNMSGYHEIVAAIQNVCQSWLLSCDSCINWQDQYALLWYLCGCLGDGGQGIPKYAHHVPLIPHTDRPLTNEDLKFCYCSRVFFCTYDVPTLRQTILGPSNISFRTHGNGDANPGNSNDNIGGKIRANVNLLNAGTPMIGQLIRIIPYIQTDYANTMFCVRVGGILYKGLTDWKKTLWLGDLNSSQQSLMHHLTDLNGTSPDKLINYNGPLVLHSRDGHACSTNHNSALMEQHWLASNYRYMNGTNNHYQTGWHEQRKGLLFGFISGRKDLNDPQIMPDHQWQQTFGRAFCLTEKSLSDGSLTNELTICPDRLFTLALYPNVKSGNINQPEVGPERAYTFHDYAAKWNIANHNYNQPITQWNQAYGFGSQPKNYQYGIDEFVGTFAFQDTNGKSGWEQAASPVVKEIFNNSLYVQCWWTGNFKRAQDYMSLLLNWGVDPLDSELQHQQALWGKDAPLSGMNADFEQYLYEKFTGPILTVASRDRNVSTCPPGMDGDKWIQWIQRRQQLLTIDVQGKRIYDDNSGGTTGRRKQATDFSSDLRTLFTRQGARNSWNFNQWQSLNYIQPPSICMFTSMIAMTQALLFEFFFHVGQVQQKFPSSHKTTYADVIHFMYETHDIISYPNKMDTEGDAPFADAIRTMSAQIQFPPENIALITHLIPPVYCYLETLFNNSGTQHSVMTELYNPIMTREALSFFVSEFTNRALNPEGSGISNFIYYYKKVYNIFNCLATQGPNRTANRSPGLNPDGDGFQTTMGNDPFFCSDTDAYRDPACVGWDFRQFYQPTRKIRITIPRHHSNLCFQLF